MGPRAQYLRSKQRTTNRYTAGVAAKVDVAQAEPLLKSTQAQAVDLGVQRAQLEHAIALLVGEPPTAFALASVSSTDSRPARTASPRMPALPLNQYKAGVVGFSNVITVQTVALGNERAAVALLARRLTAAVTLVKAVGGGWHVPTINVSADEAAPRRP